MTADERIDKIIDITARHESGGSYSAWNPNDAGKGVSYGLIQFNQRVGSLPTLLKLMHQADPQRFVELFDWASESLLGVAWVKTTDKLNMLKDAFIEAGKWPTFQSVQRRLARTEYFNPVIKLLANLGYSERTHALCFDIAVQFGVGGLTHKIKYATTRTEGTPGSGFPISEKAFQIALAAEADGPNENGRRHKILKSIELSDEPLFGGSD